MTAKIESKQKERFSHYLYIYRNFQHRKLRYVLTITGVAICVVFFIVIASLSMGVMLEVRGELEPEIRPDENTTAEEDSETEEVNELNSDLERTLLGWLYVTTLIVFLTAIFLVSNTMIISMLERRREVGILKAVGVSLANIRRLFFIESMWIVTAGWVVGTFVGVHLSNNIFNAMFESGESTIFFGPLRTPPVIILIALLIVMLVGISAALWPLNRVAKVSVMEAIRP
ncbi:MAG: FtsX-like permease family protein [Thermoplasmata archaeon]|nr:MAG: FtsX-like permease family protein [Thermoplasmata archaeon]